MHHTPHSYTYTMHHLTPCIISHHSGRATIDGPKRQRQNRQGGGTINRLYYTLQCVHSTVHCTRYTRVLATRCTRYTLYAVLAIHYTLYSLYTIRCTRYTLSINSTSYMRSLRTFWIQQGATSVSCTLPEA
jgi:hypothetical protein